MELILRAAAAALCTAVLGLLLKRTSPELSTPFSMAAVAGILLAALGFTRGVLELFELARKTFDVSDTMLLPIMKCTAIGVLTKLSADLCRDASQAAVASAVEMAGTVCALMAVMPLLLSMLKMVGDLL